MTLLVLLAAFVLLAILGLGWLKAMDRRADRAEWRRLARLQPDRPELFHPDRVAGLPEPARRYFGFTIRPGTPILPVAEITMRGRFSLGTKDAPNYQAMEAHQILAAPIGFLWAMRTRSGMPVSGSDSARWTRFRLFGLIPVARLGDDPDHRRSAFGRFVAEAVFWTPAAVLPGPGVTWQADDENRARVTLRHGGLTQSVEVTVDSEGRPVQVEFQRWSDANPDKIHRLQPFGGRMSDFRNVGGYCLPFRVEAGNMFETDEYFPCFLAHVDRIRFPQRSSPAEPTPIKRR